MYEIYADGKLLFATQYADDPDCKVLAPKVEFSEIGRAGTCSFTMLPGHPLYNSLQEKKTTILVKANNTVIFKGCVANETRDFYNQKEIQCEGDLTYLTRTQVRPSKFTKTAEDLFKYYISEHNKRVESNRQFIVGTISNDNAKTKVTLDESSFQDTKSAIEGNLIDYYGGYIRTRDQNGVSYIDWVKDYNRKSAQVINFGENLLDLSQSISPDDIFSVLIPIGQDGKTISSVNNGKDYLEVDGAIAKWDRIEKAVDFSNITDATKLKEAGLKYISTNYDGSPLSITLNAINLAHAGISSDDIFIGDRVRIISKPHNLDKEYMCVSVSYDLYSPDKTSYTFGKKIQELTKKYTQNARATSSAISEARSSAGRGTAAVNNRLDQYITATDDTLTLQHENIMLNAQNIAINAEQIALRATKEEANALGNRISTVEIDLNGDETTIGIKAELRQTIDDLGGLDSRLSRAEIDINGAEGTIGLKTMVAENREWLKKNDGTLDILDRRLSTAEIDINGGEGTIGLKTSVETIKKNLDATTKNVTNINTRLSKAEIDINGDAGTIGLKTSVKTLQEDVNDTTKKLASAESRLSKAEIDINGDAGTIGLKTSVSTLKKKLDDTGSRITDLDSRLSTAEIDINGGEGTIGLKTSVNETKKNLDATNKTITGINSRLTTAEIDINGNAGTIGLKTQMTSTIKKVDTNTGRLTTAFERISAAEINIDSQNAQIQLKASQDTVNKIDDRVTKAESTLTVNANEIATKVSKNGVISSINQTSESIVIKANKIDLSGYVTASELSAEVARIDRFFSGDSVINYLHAAKAAIAGALSCGGPFKVGEHTLGFKAMTVVNSFTQASGETSTEDSYVLAGSITIPGSTTYTPEAGTTIPL